MMKVSALAVASAIGLGLEVSMWHSGSAAEATRMKISTARLSAWNVSRRMKRP